METQELKPIIIKEEYALLKNEQENKYFIFRKYAKQYEEIPKEKIKVKDDNEITYHSFVMYESEKYESLKINNKINEDFILNIFDFISSQKWTLSETLYELKKIITDNKKIMQLTEMRGLFAELKCALEFELQPSKNSNSIYDFIDGNKDVEVKSYSKIRRQIMLSYQQLSNNPKAELIYVEVIESSDGETVFELFRKIKPEYQQKFSEIFQYDEKLSETKFKASKIDKINIKNISKGLKIPKKCTNAILYFNVDLI